MEQKNLMKVILLNLCLEHKVDITCENKLRKKGNTGQEFSNMKLLVHEEFAGGIHIYIFFKEIKF